MLIVSYDISDNKLRSHFSKYLEKFGFRLQYSVFQINNSDRLLKIIATEVKTKFEKRFSQSDSIIILKLSDTCKITQYGYAKNNETDFILVE